VWRGLLVPDNLLQGLATYALPLLLILGVHEAAHFIAARRHGLRPTLPLFLPLPPGLGPPIGTLGALVSLRDPMPDRKALFDTGVSGPLAGFAVAIPILLLGVMLTNSAAMPVPDIGRPTVGADVPVTVDARTPGATFLSVVSPAPGTMTFNLTAPRDRGDWPYHVEATVWTPEGPRTDAADGTLAPGRSERRTFAIPEGATEATLRVTWDAGLLHFGDPLLVLLLQTIGFGSSETLLTHPTWVAGWVGLLVTGLNLLPLGQLDGGHVARAVLGERMRIFSYAAMALMVFLTLQYQIWFLFTLLILVLGIHHPPPLDERTPLGRARMVWAVVAAIVLAITFVAVPFHA
jgi:membrane-associated protease RseP (regulator of RpoE activity)